MLHPYIRLVRLNQPTGIWLLLWPCWWSLALAAPDLPPLKLLVLFAVGAVVMRSAGCVFNDIIDRRFDAQVERTRLRPLASGEIKLNEAVVLLVLLLFIALDIAMQLNAAARWLAVASLILVASYPFMKRITFWPQAFLGLAFNWGALMGWAAVDGSLGLPAFMLYLGGIGWTLGYDTIYAHQDKEDDMRIGVKSTALRLKDKSRQWIAGFYAFALFCWGLAGAFAHAGALFYIGLFAAAAHFVWQVMYVKPDDPANCLFVFRSNAMMGWLFFAGIWMNGLQGVALQL